MLGRLSLCVYMMWRREGRTEAGTDVKMGLFCKNT